MDCKNVLISCFIACTKACRIKRIIINRFSSYVPAMEIHWSFYILLVFRALESTNFLPKNSVFSSLQWHVERSDIPGTSRVVINVYNAF